MAAFVIAQFDIHEIDSYYEYSSKIFSTLQPFGGRILAANDAEVFEGTIPHKRTIVGSFQDMATAKAWYNSDAYQAIINLRKDASTGHLIMVEGLFMPPRDKACPY